MKQPARYGRNLRAYRRKAARVRRSSTICSLCGKQIDHTLPATDPMSATADHLHPLAAGGHILGDMYVAHRRCNSEKGAGTTAPKRQPTSRTW